jgi:hypothetical protein
MKSFIYATNFLTPTIITISSEQALNFPATRALDYMHPKRPWKTTTIGSTQDLLVDFGSTIVLNGVFANRLNYRLVQIQADTSTGTTPVTPSASYFAYTTDSGSQVVPIDLMVGRRKIFFHFADISCRYLRWRIPAQSTDDGQSAFSTGALAFTTNTTVMPGGHIFPIAKGAGAAFKTNEFEDKGKEFIKMGDRVHDLRFSGSMDGKTQHSHILTFMGLEPGAPFLYAENSWLPGYSAATPPTGQPENSYLMTFNAEIRPQYQAPEVFDAEIALDEIV